MLKPYKIKWNFEQVTPSTINKNVDCYLWAESVIDAVNVFAETHNKEAEIVSIELNKKVFIEDIAGSIN